MIEELLLPFQFEFMIRAFIITTIIAVPTALLSCYLVLKGWSLMGDAISHAVLPGVVLAYLINIPLIIGAFGAGMVCALATGFLKDNSRIKQDTVMGVVFSGMFGFGLVIYTKIETDVHLDHILFGNMLGVSWGDILTTGLIALFVAVIVVLKRRDFLLHAFDPAQAQAAGLNVKLLHYGLLAILSLTIVATLKAVGIILAIGLLIAPGAIAFLLTQRFELMLVLAVLLTMFAGLTGVYFSFFIGSASAPTIVLILSGIFIVCFIWKTQVSARRVTSV
ncbi:metal ABC transporter permease [Pseudohalocynthiibacter aestuariivivens]|jgi:manganese/iron transport system permease protein|uniref:Metal ABC transporter permease n=1 Tax=Pseudohalocynthiibacter aestuariivivens TaxID=1591409 RepID=A0ABV5JDK1_9RHOB|nr:MULTISPECIES: metal ABC transporter permease [Pseudohalocynthiibacter]MBS9715600.1 metal ABC transporter permease [Pseudohalocynthiibacter aestuariivivens]MCK0101214.1 metal ABC transporter permease [Pseudohalocynthiibacter sp. F2068]